MQRQRLDAGMYRCIVSLSVDELGFMVDISIVGRFYQKQLIDGGPSCS